MLEMYTIQDAIAIYKECQFTRNINTERQNLKEIILWPVNEVPAGRENAIEAKKIKYRIQDYKESFKKCIRLGKTD
jgi:hypothetical protein